MLLVEPGGKKVSAIVALSSFILYNEFCVQILVPPSIAVLKIDPTTFVH